MEAILHFLITPSAAMLLLSVVSVLSIFVYVFSTSIPNEYFVYSGGDIRHNKNSSRAATFTFACMVILAFQAVGFYALDYSNYLDYIGRVTVSNVEDVMDNFNKQLAVEVVKHFAWIYVIGTILSIPVFWKMLNKSYISTIRTMMKAQTGHEDFEEAVLSEVRKKLFDILAGHTAVASKVSKEHDFGQYTFPGNRTETESESEGLKGPKGLRESHLINVDVHYLNSTLKLEHTAFSFSAVGELTTTRLSSVNPLFSFVSLPAENKKLFESASSVDNAIFLVNTAYVSQNSLRDCNQQRASELVKAGYAAPLYINFFTEESKAMLVDVTNTINSGKKYIALDPSVLANQVGIMAMNWPLFLVSVATFKIRNLINSVVKTLRTLLKAISENATKEL